MGTGEHLGKKLEGVGLVDARLRQATEVVGGLGAAAAQSSRTFVGTASELDV